MLLRIFAALLALSLVSAFADPHQVRRWTGKNGKTFEGAYMGVDKASGKYSFILDRGKAYLIDPNNLSDEDLKWLEGELHPEKKAKAAEGDWINFLADPEFDRKTLPVIDQNDYGSKSSDCVPSAFIVYWDNDKNYIGRLADGDLLPNPPPPVDQYPEPEIRIRRTAQTHDRHLPPRTHQPAPRSAEERALPDPRRRQLPPRRTLPPDPSWEVIALEQSLRNRTNIRPVHRVNSDRKPCSS